MIKELISKGLYNVTLHLLTGKNCNVGEWSEWGVCGTVGGPHVKTRTRRVGSQAACAGVQPIMYLQCRNLGELVGNSPGIVLSYYQDNARIVSLFERLLTETS